MPSRAGSPNKNKQALLKILQAKYPDYHPVLELATIAHESEDETIRFNAHKEVAQYVTPKLKAVEHSGNIDSKVQYKPIIKRFDGSVEPVDDA